MSIKVKVTVTEEDIKNGKKQSRKYCPIGLALSREIGTFDVSVGTDQIQFCIWSVEERSSAATPPKAVRFIKMFDDGKTVKPTVFELEFTKWK